MMRFLIVLVVCLFVLTGCGKMIFITPQYINKKIERKSLVVADMEIFIDNPKDVADDLGEGNPRTIYKDFFEFNFKSEMTQLSTFEEVNFCTITNENEFIEQVFNIGKKDKIYMNIPSHNQVVKTDSIYGDFILFIQEFKVYRKGANIPNQTGITGVTWKTNLGSQPDLRTTFNFVLWDNNQKQVVSYGKADCPTKFGFSMKYDTWERSITNIAKEILIDTPFENFPEDMMY